jgi:outer membrane receptor protein involved in Fe transport
MDNNRVVELPLNGRQVTDLIVLSGAATISATTGNVRNYPTVNISVAGGMHNGLTFLLDGASHNDPTNGLNLPLPFPDALQEFKLETSSLSAQYGQHSAGTVNAITKSGTNEFHGDVFEFVRNGALNARNAFATAADSLKRNQFGGAVGGRIIKDKLFFFGGYQGTRIRATPAPQFATLPTPQMLSGDWSTISSPQCNGGRQITLKAPFVNNRIDPALYSPVAANILKSGLLPVPSDPCGQIQFGMKPVTNENISLAKVDYQWSEKHSLFARYELAHLVDPPAFTPGNLLTTGQAVTGAYTTYPVVNDWQTQSFAVGDTYLIRTNVVSSFRAAAIRPTNFRGTPPPEIAPESVGIQNIYEPPELKNRILGLSISGGFAIGAQGGNVPGLTNATGYQTSEDLSWVHGAHQLGFGANYIRSILNSNAYTTSAGAFAFTAANTGSGLGDFMLGKPNTFQQASVGQFNFRDNYIGVYVQDTWKVNSRLTVNGGLRWDPYVPLYWKNGQVFHFDQKWFDQGLRSAVYTNAPAGVLYTGDPGVPNDAKNQPNQWLHFSPRLGLAFDPKGDGRMTIRASYGLFRDYPDLYQSQHILSSPPFNSVVTLQTPVGGLADPWQGYPGGNPFPIAITKNSVFPTSATWYTVPLDLPAVYVHEWNLSVQKQLGTSWLVSANYIGNEVIHLLNNIEANPAVYLPGPSCIIAGKTYSPCSSTANTTQRRNLFLLNPSQGQYFGQMVQEDAGGTMSYNGLLLTAQHRIANGLTIQANYTSSHCINTGTSQVFGSGTAGGPYTSPRLASSRGNCAGLEVDRRHNFNLSTVYATPRFANGAMRMVATGWQLSGILKILSGDYSSVTSGIDASLTGVTSDQRPDQVLPNVYASNKGIGQWLNPAAFAQPGTGLYGNMGARNIMGPGFIGIDVGLTRKFQIRERESLEIRGEAFNLPNHTNPLDPVLTLTSNTFGQIQAASDPRILQLAMKFLF